MGSFDEKKLGAQKHRGASGDMRRFAEEFIAARLAGFEKDMKICLTGIPSKTRSGLTHAYFPALSACCGTLEYLTALHRGNRNRIGWQQVSVWSQRYLPQPDFDQDIVRILFEAFRHSVAHRGIASGIWVDRNQGPGLGRRITWRVLADSQRPSCNLVPESGKLRRDPPWLCTYSHRMHIHLASLKVDIRDGANRYKRELRFDGELLENFESCMRQLYPQ